MRRFFESLYLWAKLMYLGKNIDFDEEGDDVIDGILKQVVVVSAALKS